MKKTFILCLLFCLLSACSSKPTIHIDFNQEANFQLFSSYQFSPQMNNSVGTNPIMINRIQNAVELNLANKGLKKRTFIDINSADLTIDISYNQQEKEDNSSFSIGLGTSKIGRNTSGSIGISTSVPINSAADVITHIVIDMSDTKQTIWHGSDSYETSEDISIEEKNRAVTNTVNKLLANFPPPALDVNTKK